MADLSHVDESGRPRMVDVSDKQMTARRAVAGAVVTTRPEVIDRIRSGDMGKGPVLDTARIAGIQAAKRTAELIPLCHPLPLDAVDVRCELADDRVIIEAEARTTARTGVEMEAMTAAAVAALTVYDMCKAADRAMTVDQVRLLAKSGGKSGDYRRDP